MIAFRIAAALLIAALCVPAAAQELDTRHYVYVEASGTVTLPAEYARVSATATTKGATPDVVVDANNATMNKLLAALQQSGIKRSDIETGSFGFEAVYIRPETATAYDKPDPDRDKFDGYRVTNSFNIKVRDLTSIGKVLGLISRSGVEIGSLTFATSKQNEAEGTSRQKAVENAFDRAQIMATASHVKLGALLQMREGTGYNPETMEPYPSDGDAADLITLPLDGIVPAAIVVTNSVSAKWEVVPAD